MFCLADSWVWDFWLAQEDDTYHLFFLHASRALHDPDRRHLRAGIGHAVSTDLRSWRRVADALVHGDQGSVDETATWTGSVVQGPDGQWYMFYTGTTDTGDGLRQQIGLATSTDLYHWVKSPEPATVADPRWYETLGGTAPWQDEHWRDPWVYQDPTSGDWHMLITARSTTGELDDRGVLGHAVSADLRHWATRPPVTAPGSGFGQLEVPQVANIDGQWMLIFNCLTGELSDASRDAGATGGIWVAPADSALGPFDLSAAVQLSDDRLYVGKLVQDPAGDWVLLAFHNRTDDGGFGGTISDPIPVRREGRVVALVR
ncbi:MAG: glycosyl hydrolase family 32 [Nakamurella sp.]